MENLELSLSSLGTISRHVDKNHSDLSQYLSKQVRPILSLLGGVTSCVWSVSFSRCDTGRVLCAACSVLPFTCQSPPRRCPYVGVYVVTKQFCFLFNPWDVNNVKKYWLICGFLWTNQLEPSCHVICPQIWSQLDRQCILECLAQLLLEKDYTLLIARHLRPLVLDLLERSAERVRAGGRINHDLHERLCVALSKLLGISPDAQA